MTEDEYIDFGIQQLEQAMVTSKWTPPPWPLSSSNRYRAGQAGFLPVPPRFLRAHSRSCVISTAS